jgi:putative permease
MFEVLKAWFFKYFGEADAAILLIALAVGAIVIWLFGRILAPLFAGIVIAYLLEGLITPLQKYLKFPRWLAVTTIFTLFIGLLIMAIISLIPTFAHQLTQFVNQVPTVTNQLYTFFDNLSERYPHIISNNFLQHLSSTENMQIDTLNNFGNSVITHSLASLSTIMTGVVYLFLVPLLTFFILKDKDMLLAGATEYMPEHRGLILEVWYEMRTLLGRYVRGKVLEIIIVTLATWGVFAVFKLNYAFLLAFLTGISAILPYIGILVVSVPVVIVALLQFGLSPDCVYLLLAYAVIQILDGNLLVPLLFSEAMNLNAVVIITAVLFFGGLWGFWGLFFAIPLATLLKAVVKAWVRHANRHNRTVEHLHIA